MRFSTLGTSSGYLRCGSPKSSIFSESLSQQHIQSSRKTAVNKKMYNIFSQFFTVNTLSGNKGCNDFPRACTCLIIQKKIDSGTMVWNTKICKRSKLWGKATKEKKKKGIMVRGTYGGRIWSSCVSEFPYIHVYKKESLWSDRKIIIYSSQYSDQGLETI